MFSNRRVAPTVTVVRFRRAGVIQAVELIVEGREEVGADLLLEGFAAGTDG